MAKEHVGHSEAALFSGVPRPYDISAKEVAALRSNESPVLIVLDDDPTGTQSVRDLPVLTHWDGDDFQWALNTGASAIYVMTNSRSLDPAAAKRVNLEVAEAAWGTAERLGKRIQFVSRSDSTLRGHYPLEPDALTQFLGTRGVETAAVIIVPAFSEAGRITVDSIHYAFDDKRGYVPVGETEYARDSTFGYESSDLGDWVVEKSRGKIPLSEIFALNLKTLRKGPASVADFLSKVPAGSSIVVDAAHENDLRVLAAGLLHGGNGDKHYLYRVGPPFVRALIGQNISEPIAASTTKSLNRKPDVINNHGLIVIGSHVNMTNRQLTKLRAAQLGREVQLDARKLLASDHDRDQHVANVTQDCKALLREGNVILSTSRTLITGHDASSSLDIARSVSNALISIVYQIAKEQTLRFVVAKGGITSSDVATRALKIRRAMVKGPLLPGIISLWEPTDGLAVGIPYVVFAGNVGDENSLTAVVEYLSTNA